MVDGKQGLGGFLETNISILALTVSYISRNHHNRAKKTTLNMDNTQNCLVGKNNASFVH